MLVRVRMFARARDLAGTEVVAVDVPEGATVAQLRRALVEICPGLARLVDSSRMALDEEFAQETTVLTRPCALALLPPVSGG